MKRRRSLTEDKVQIRLQVRVSLIVGQLTSEPRLSDHLYLIDLHPINIFRSDYLRITWNFSLETGKTSRSRSRNHS